MGVTVQLQRWEEAEGTLLPVQSPCLVTTSSVLSLGREGLRTCCPISLPASHCELDDKVVALPPCRYPDSKGGAGGWCSKAEAALKQDQEHWSHSFRGSTGCGVTFHLVPIRLEVSSAGTSTTGCFSPSRLNAGVVYPGPDPVSLTAIGMVGITVPSPFQ